MPPLGAIVISGAVGLPTRPPRAGPAEGHSRERSTSVSAAYLLDQGEFATRYTTVIGGLRENYINGGIRDYLPGRQRGSSVRS